MTHVRPLLIIPKATARSNAGTRPSRAIASASQPAVARRRPPHRGRLRRPLQHRPPAQCHRLRHAQGQARGRDQEILPPAIANWPRPANVANSSARPHEHASHLPTARPAIDFAAVRAAVTMRPCCTCSASEPGSRSRRPTARRRARCTARTGHQPLLLRQPGAPDLPLLQVRPLRQRPGPVGPDPEPVVYDAALDLCQRLSIPLPLLPNPGTGTEKRKP